MNLPQARGREHRRAQAVAMTHVVIAGAEAIGREHTFHVLAQGGGFTGHVDPRQLGNQVLGQRNALFAIKGVMQQMAQQ